MKALSDTLQAMKLPEALPKEPKHGSTMLDGHSITGLPTSLNQLSQMASTDIDEALRAALKSLSTLVVGSKKSSIFKGDEFIGVEEIPFLEGGEIDEAKPITRWLEATSTPAAATFISQEIHKLALSTAKRSDGEADYALQIGVYIADLAQYPQDVIAWACSESRRSCKFFPVVKELRDLCDERMKYRRRLLSLLTAAQRSPIPQIEKSPDRQDTPRAQWNDADWKDYVADAEKMLATAQAHPAALSVDTWQAEVEKRTREYGEAQARMLAAG